MKLVLESFANDTSRNRILWGALSFQSGWINIGGFMACHRFVTHTTGFATQFGADLALFKWMDSMSMLLVPFFFLLGSIISAFYVDHETTQHRKAKYHVVFFYMFCFLILVTFLGYTGAFGFFGSEFELKKDFFLVALLCLSSGLQNASISSASQNLIRTTHLTGLTSDLGIGLVRGFFSKQTEENRLNLIRILQIICFIFGSAGGAYAFLNIQYLAFLLPACLCFIIYLISLMEYRDDRFS